MATIRDVTLTINYHDTENVTPVKSSFSTLALNGSTLSVNGTDYNLSLAQTAEGTDSSLSSFKGVAAVDNGDGTISLTVGDNSVAVEKYEAAPAITYPVKGDLITMTLGNATPAAGMQNTYRVLKVDGTQAEVVAMFDQSTSQTFDFDNTYAGSDLDAYLTTWYNSLNATAQAAIVAKNVQQYQYSYSPSVYNATTHASYADYSTKATKGSAVSRYVYALDVEDIETYFGGRFSTANIWTLFWNTTSAPGTPTYPWLRSADADNSLDAFCVYGDDGLVVDIYDVGGSGGSVVDDFVGSVYAARPAFTIDLSKIEWSKV